MLKKFKSSVNKYIWPLIILLSLPQVVCAYTAADFNWIPPFLARDEKPSIIIIFDNSGSMLGRAYSGAFNSTREYYGYFNPRSYYRYNDSVTPHRFVPDSTAAGVWNGNFLNWATMHRVDVARKVMGGGNFNNATNLYEVITQDTGNRVASFTYNDSTQVTDLNGNTRHMTPYANEITIRHPNSENRMRITRKNVNHYYELRVQEPRKEGVLQAFKDKARMSLFVYDSNTGGRVQRHMSEDVNELNGLINTVNTINPTTWTPLAETLFTVYGYIRQHAEYDSTTGPRYHSGNTSYEVSATRDPFYFPALGVNVQCTKQNVILITDGESTEDQGIPDTFGGATIKNRINPKPTANYDLVSNGSPYLIDVAHWGQTTDMRPDLAGNQTVDFYAVFAFGSGSNLLRDAARYGKFKQSGPFSNGNNMPDLASEYDSDGDGIPDNYFEAESGQELEAAIFQAFQLATANIASGTAAAVTSQTRSGEGAAYQALFFPPSSASQIAPAWSGQVHAFLLDARGNMREDTNGNGRLDLIEDRVIQFDETQVFVSVDANGDMIIDASERNATSLNSINEINFLWSTTPWLNTMSDTNALLDRSYTSLEHKRHIFTFVDDNRNMVAHASKVIPFTDVTADCNHPVNFCSYLTLYGNNTGAVSPVPSGLSGSDMFNLASRQVQFIRGVDVGNATIGGIQDNTRSRKHGANTWRLGDIIYSSPTVVSKPAENYHLLYKDKSYEDFVKKYQNRRQVIYTGGNDGMLHAFNGGFYNSTSLSPTSRGAFQLTWTNGETPHPLGAELWAYVPFNLLPHLKWLMNPEYGENLHVAYMDLKPRIFDARVFPHGDANSTHPNGWGTILVAGMRLGGAQIGVDVTKNGVADMNATSAYVIMDITDPEQAPTLLGEITMPKQGFTTCYPTVMPMATPNSNSTADNNWYLVFGSGPADDAGLAARFKLGIETSNQNGQLYVVDLKALVTEKTLKTIHSSGAITTGVGNATAFATVEPNSFVSDPIAVDLDLGRIAGEFKTDAVYYGTVSGGQTNGQGTLRRLLTTNSQDPLTWSGNTTLYDAGRPITAAPSVAFDDADPNRVWVYFGAGRFYSREDIPQASRMSFYGVREPLHTNGTISWETVNGSLFNSTDVVLNNSNCGGVNTQDCVRVFKGGTLMTGTFADGSWQNLMAAVDAAPGWRLDFNSTSERVLGQAAILGGAVLFTSYLPSNNICDFEGTSNLWALYYRTGTAYYKPILGTYGDVIRTSVSIGRGLASSPSIHVSEGGTNAITQTGYAAQIKQKIEEPFPARSRALFWESRTDLSGTTPAP